MTINVVGLRSDRTLQRFVGHARRRGHSVRLLDLGDIVENRWRVELTPDRNRLIIQTSTGEEQEFDSEANYYQRMVDLSAVLPEPHAISWRHTVAALAFFLDGASGTVVNAPGGHTHNGAKPLHEAWLSRCGFRVPRSLTSSTRWRLQAFAQDQGRVIVKALAGTRGSAEIVGPEVFDDFETEQGPVHLQAVVAGYDVRVHMVAGRAFAERIDTDADDYRDRDAVTQHMDIEVPGALVESMEAASREMGLLFTGWDFRVDDRGRWWCLEANPMPGYDVYDRRCGGAISETLCELLAHAPCT